MKNWANCWGAWLLLMEVCFRIFTRLCCRRKLVEGTRRLALHLKNFRVFSCEIGGWAMRISSQGFGLFCCSMLGPSRTLIFVLLELYIVFFQWILIVLSTLWFFVILRYWPIFYWVISYSEFIFVIRHYTFLITFFLTCLYEWYFI